MTNRTLLIIAVILLVVIVWLIAGHPLVSIG